jgi:membrane protein implicated in regulation of membrane protease activity
MTEQAIVFWYWWVLAVGFLGLELLVSGFFFLWLAVSGFVVGTLAWLLPESSFQIQLIVFSLLAVTSVLLWRKYANSKLSISSDHPLLNRRGEQYVGRTFNLVEPIKNGIGKIKVDGTLWTVQGTDCSSGSKVKVVAALGTQFQVEKCD